ncbi:MAG: ribonuclease P protein component [Spirochaetaceae bacterium]|jgi:ribonuclease P protein component|nr:ribonuclease P protein component [Spirochaetaceae bacterium]
MDLSFRFRRTERLKRRDEIRAVFNRGKGVTCSGAKLFCLKNGLSYNRIAFTFGRKFGNAVQRNRARRVGREAYRHIRQSIQGGYDLVLLVYPGKDTFKTRFEQLKALFSKAGLYYPQV